MESSQDQNPVEDKIISSDNPEQLDGGEHLSLVVGHGIRLRRLDKYLHGRFGHFSRTVIQRMIKDQGVTVNGRPAKASLKLNPKDVVDLIVPVRERREIIPEDIPLDIIYEDDQIIVINKQANIIVHPARSHTHGTLANALMYHSEQLSSVGGDFRPGIVHRLDRNTTGVMVVAKNDTAHCNISRQFEKRTTEKHYLAIVHGRVSLDADCVNQPLGIHPKIREKYAIRHDIGKEAITFYHTLERFQGYSLVLAKPKTGRTHQIRIHLNYIKHSIVADDMYGGQPVYPWQIEGRDIAAEDPLMGRCALHARRLFIYHPETGERMEFEAPLPGDMQNLLDELRKNNAE